MQTNEQKSEINSSPTTSRKREWISPRVNDIKLETARNNLQTLANDGFIASGQ